MQKSLRDAQDAQLVKAGEVSILRQTIDKVCIRFLSPDNVTSSVGLDKKGAC